MQNFRGGGFFSNIPPVVKNILLINVIMLLATAIFEMSFNTDLTQILGLYFYKSVNFNPYQYVTYIFMHGGIMHLFFNMFAVWMFGRVLEQVWGGKRFFIFFMVTGIGAALVHTIVNWIEMQSVIQNLSREQINIVFSEGFDVIRQGKNYTNPYMGQLNLIVNIPTVGASGAVFGILLAFGMLFPNTQLMLLFPPIPIKAKYFVIGYGVIELFAGVSNQPGDNIAHFAHLGGMIFGFILIKLWGKHTHDRWN
jgi:membrane associated rhomboid family serine protease